MIFQLPVIKAHTYPTFSKIHFFYDTQKRLLDAVMCDSVLTVESVCHAVF